MHPPEPLRPQIFETLRDLAREGAVEVTVRGSCMAPRIADGERVRVAAARFCWPATWSPSRPVTAAFASTGFSATGPGRAGSR